LNDSIRPRGGGQGGVEEGGKERKRKKPSHSRAGFNLPIKKREREIFIRVKLSGKKESTDSSSKKRSNAGGFL